MRRRHLRGRMRTPPPHTHTPTHSLVAPLQERLGLRETSVCQHRRSARGAQHLVVSAAQQQPVAEAVERAALYAVKTRRSQPPACLYPHPLAEGHPQDVARAHSLQREQAARARARQSTCGGGAAQSTLPPTTVCSQPWGKTHLLQHEAHAVYQNCGLAGACARQHEQRRGQRVRRRAARRSARPPLLLLLLLLPQLRGPTSLRVLLPARAKQRTSGGFTRPCADVP